jgi:hypothetical protein
MATAGGNTLKHEFTKRGDVTSVGPMSVSYRRRSAPRQYLCGFGAGSNSVRDPQSILPHDSGKTRARRVSAGRIFLRPGLKLVAGSVSPFSPARDMAAACPLTLTLGVMPSPSQSKQRCRSRLYWGL